MVNDRLRDTLNSIGLLILRLSAGGMMAYGHGLGKFQAFNARSASFPDPLGIGSPTSMALAIFGELFCSVLIMLGLGTRLAAFPVAFTMVVAAFVVHADDPTFMFQARALGQSASKEMALVYMAPFVALVFTGPGRFSLDQLIWPRITGKKQD